MQAKSPRPFGRAPFCGDFFVARPRRVQRHAFVLAPRTHRKPGTPKGCLIISQSLGSVDIMDVPATETHCKQNKERRGKCTRCGTLTRSDAVMRRNPFCPEGLWRPGLFSCVAFPRRSTLATPSSSRLGSEPMAHTTLIHP